MELFELRDKYLIKSCQPILADLYKNFLRDYINLFFVDIHG